MSNRRNGGIIGPQNRTLYSSAPGVWHLDDAQESSGAKNWPGGPAAPYSVTYLAVAGGGGGGYNDGGGGGAGGLLSGSVTLNPGSTYTISVGSGGSGSGATGNNNSTGSNGNPSNISGSGITTISASGGGGGGSLINAAVSGGSGGGGGSLFAPGNGTSLQGNSGGAGGNISTGYYLGGGGGGANAAGSSATTVPGSGGAGLSSSITGSAVNYAGGGGGGGDNRVTTASVSFNGSTDYLSLPNSSAIQLGSNNFTIEAWIYLTAYPSYASHVFWINGDSGGSSFAAIRACVNPSGTITLLMAQGSSWSVNANSTATVSLNQWYHFAITRSGTSVTLYLNGTSVITGTVSGALLTGTTNWIANMYYIGSGTWLWQGYISNVRLVNGTAVYTSNFTPPTSPLPVIANTALLTCLGTGFFDASANSLTVTPAGSPTNTITSPFTTVRANISGASGGVGGGGTGAGGANGNATTGSVNTGGGGGGGAVTSNIAASGGSGIVVLSIPTLNYTGLVTGSPTVTISGANTVVQFNGNGTYVA